MWPNNQSIDEVNVAMIQWPDSVVTTIASESDPQLDHDPGEHPRLFRCQSEQEQWSVDIRCSKKKVKEQRKVCLLLKEVSRKDEILLHHSLRPALGTSHVGWRPFLGERPGLHIVLF